MPEGRLHADSCLEVSRDRAERDGHLYTDKAPGLSLVEIPSVAAVRLPDPSSWPYEYERLWIVRVASVGLCFLLAAFVVGRISEGLAPGFGAAGLVSFALGTLVAPVAAIGFDHVPAAALGLAAFALAWARRPLAAGLVGGAAVLVEYEVATIVAIVGGYVLFQGVRPAARYVAGALPACLLLLAYDWAAFGAPWRFSYRYVAEEFKSEQEKGLFGITTPRLHSIHEVFIGREGLLLVSPIVVAAAVGLVLLARRHRAEAAVCAIVVAVFLLVNCGYFSPYGGVSPGPRFLIPALPFLALGLGPAFERFPIPAALLAAASVVATTAVMLTWARDFRPPDSIWPELWHLPARGGSSALVQALAASALHPLGVGRSAGAILIAAAAVAALTLAVAAAARVRRGGD